jgi:hypothetical protein
MVKPIGVVPAAMLALATLAAPACATGYGYGPGYRDGGYVYGDRGYGREVQRLAYDNGFHDGVRAGEKDARRHHRFEPSRNGDWRDADDGYHRNYGDREFYRRSFRSGFEAGYSQGFGRYGYDGYRRW